MAEHRCPTTAQVQAMIDASGGGGADVKGGHVAGIACNSAQAVTFSTAFSGTPSVVCNEDGVSGKDHAIQSTNVSTTGFTIAVVKTHSGGACSNVGVYWIATDAGDI